jgi:hypothetical protein
MTLAATLENLGRAEHQIGLVVPFAVAGYPQPLVAKLPSTQVDFASCIRVHARAVMLIIVPVSRFGRRDRAAEGGKSLAVGDHSKLRDLLPKQSPPLAGGVVRLRLALRDARLQFVGRWIERPGGSRHGSSRGGR